VRAAWVIVLVACGTAPAGVDSGEPDAGNPDAGTADAGKSDAGTPDAGTADAGLPDAGTADAGPEILCTANGIPGTCLDVAECTGARMTVAGLCPGPSNVQCCTPRTAVACDWTTHFDPNVGLTEEPSDAGCPPGMLPVDTFCIDRFEASLEGLSPYFNPGNTQARAVSLRGGVPAAYIDQLQAAAACQAAGKRLCTDAEWLRACQGPGMTTYPYGNTRQPGVCNDARAEHPAVELYGTTDSWIFSELDSPCLDELDAGLARSGAYSGCVTAEGAYDMMGNLHEWTDDPAGTFRGGFFVDTVLNGNGCLYATTAHNTTYWDYSTGFRCCAGP
jgi:sulfatase modifying factor 1